MDPFQTSLSPGQAQSVYPAEITGPGCEYIKNAKADVDGRFSEVGLYTNQKNLREDNAVLNYMKFLPNYFRYGPSD